MAAEPSAEEQTELDRVEIQAYSELLDRLVKATGAENYVQAVVFAEAALHERDNAQADVRHLQGRVTELNELVDYPPVP
ncbi:hypothetical protein LCGC14_0409970 [marine sediment metagenome]|uniref:Uncharacterized protein n=1 Tax=marine sediment metagenome TaxID=412755 RepID=A0A0F9W366_9ZZZZ